MKKNSNLSKAKKAKADEFYTQLADVEKELKHYGRHFRGKVVLCNCDDPEWSSFWRYFVDNFATLGLKRLISTHYKMEGNSYKLEMLGNGNTVKTVLKGNGDFRSQECIDILKESDIVVTNPPFSLFREYLSQLMENDKKFLVIGNKNAITYKEVFPLIKENRVWLGCTAPKDFLRPDGTTQKFGNICWYTNLIITKKLNGLCRWFTNLTSDKPKKQLELHKTYYGNEKDYPRYDNYDAINVDKCKDIPADYWGCMGVPITFLDHYCPEQFEIADCNDVKTNDKTPTKKHGLIKDKDGAINGKPVYARVLIRKSPQFEIVGSFNAGIHGEELGATKTAIESNNKTTMWNGPVINRKPVYKRVVIRRKK